MSNQEEAQPRRNQWRQKIIERLNAYDNGPTSHDRKVMEEVERENGRRVEEAMGTVFIGGGAGGIGGDCGGGGGDGGGC